VSYARWGNPGDWYVFACADTRGATLAVWHGHSDKLPSFTTAEVREMVATGDLSRIDCFMPKDKAELLDCFRRYLEDEDDDARRDKKP